MTYTRILCYRTEAEKNNFCAFSSSSSSSASSSSSTSSSSSSSTSSSTSSTRRLMAAETDNCKPLQPDKTTGSRRLLAAQNEKILTYNETNDLYIIFSQLDKRAEGLHDCSTVDADTLALYNDFNANLYEVGVGVALLYIAELCDPALSDENLTENKYTLELSKQIVQRCEVRNTTWGNHWTKDKAITVKGMENYFNYIETKIDSTTNTISSRYNKVGSCAKRASDMSVWATLKRHLVHFMRKYYKKKAFYEKASLWRIQLQEIKWTGLISDTSQLTALNNAIIKMTSLMNIDNPTKTNETSLNAILDDSTLQNIKEAHEKALIRGMGLSFYFCPMFHVHDYSPSQLQQNRL